MHPFQKKALERFCREHGLDVQLIDDKLSYDENKRIMQSLTIKTTEELIAWARTLKDMEKFTDLADVYGIPDGFEVQTPLILIRIYVKISRNKLKVAEVRLKPYRKHIKEIARGYFVIEGQPLEIANIIMKVEDLKPRILKLCKKFDANLQYIPSIGWVRRGN